MPAQSGDAILLAYGAAGVQQAGDALLLSYDVTPGSGQITLRSRLASPWHKATVQALPVVAPHPAIARQDTARRLMWSKGFARQSEGRATWSRIATRDADRQARWSAFGPLLPASRLAPWVGAKRADDRRQLPWGSFGDLLASQCGGRWRGSKPADHANVQGWRGHLIPVLRPVPFPRSDGAAVDFSVVGGGVDVAMFQAGGYTPPLGGALHFQFDNAPYRVPFMPADPVPYAVPLGSAADFTYAPQFELVLDGVGQPVMDKGERGITPVLPWGTSVRRDRDAVHPWLKYSRPLNPGWGVVVPGGPTAPEPGQPVIIPVKRVYIVVNEILLARVADSSPIPASQLRISLDCDSWLPSFSAVIPESARDAVMPSPNPVEIMALINGSEFRFVVEKIARSRQFGQRTVNISGRGLACELDAPYAVAAQRTNSSPMTAQQLIDAALQYTGYTQTWSIADWSVPAGALSLHGTPAELAGHVAEAAGAVLSADWALRDLRMLSRYPVKPWDFGTATPEYVIPAALAQMESVEWLEKPDYNVIYVSGQQQGLLGRVKITGTAGDKPAAMVTHPLLTHNDPIRERGLSILGNTGRKAIMQLSMPVLETTGVIDVCRFVEFSDGANTRRGIVRANNVSVDFPTVRQTLTIEASV